MIISIVIKYLKKDYSLILKEIDFPDGQFFTNKKEINGTKFEIDFVQIIGDELFVIYKEI